MDELKITVPCRTILYTEKKLLLRKTVPKSGVLYGLTYLWDNAYAGISVSGTLVDRHLTEVVRNIKPINAITLPRDIVVLG